MSQDKGCSSLHSGECVCKGVNEYKRKMYAEKSDNTCVCDCVRMLSMATRLGAQKSYEECIFVVRGFFC